MKLITNLNQSKSVLVLCFMFLTASVVAQSNDVAVGVLSFEEEVIDFGELTEKAEGESAFKFKNTGNAPIVITQVKTTCGCTVASKPENPILPGETAQIEVNYDTKKVGKFSKSITVVSNAKESKKILKIKGEVVKRSL